MELIDKMAAYEALKHEAEMHELPFTREAYERAARIIDKMHVYTIELNVRHGRWVLSEVNSDGFCYSCTECGQKMQSKWRDDEICKFCPECGAKMGE